MRTPELMNSSVSLARKPLGMLASLILGLYSPALLAQDAAPENDEVIDLNPFRVEATGAGEYTPATTSVGTIIAVPREQIPFLTSVVTDALIKDMRIDNPADVVEQIAGVSQDRNPYIAEGGTSRQISFRVRGFESRPLYNGFQTGPRIMSADNIGRVEVSKGPNAVLYGQAPAGGIINVVPKGAVFESHGSATVGVGTNDYRRLLVETGAPIEADSLGRMAFRVGAGYLDFERDQPFFESDTTSVNGAVAWQITERVTLDLQAEYNMTDIVPSRTEAFVSTGSGPARVVDPYNRLRNTRNFSYSGPHNLLERDTLLSTTYLNVKLAESLRLRLGGLYTTQDLDELELVGAFGLGTSETSSSPYAMRRGTYDTLGYKVDLLHEGELGGFGIRTLVGFEDHMEDNDFYEIRSPSVSITIPFSRELQASDFPAPPPADQFTTVRTDQRDELDWTNLRLTQFISTEDQRGTLMWGVAYGEGEATVTDNRTGASSTSEGDDTTYTVGATYKLIDGESDDALNSLAIFGNYSTSFEIQSGNQQNPADFEGFTDLQALKDFVASVTPNAIEPQTGSGFEVGVRMEMLKNRLGVSIAYFDQSRENIARTFFVRESNVPGVNSETVLATYMLAAGEENAKGVEIAFDWRPIDNLVLTGEATFTDGEVVANPEAPEEVGFGLVRSPEDMFSFWARYDFAQDSDSFLAGFSVGLGVSYNSSTRIRPEIGDRFRVSDDYTNWHALVRYSFTAWKLEHQLSLNVDNIADDEWTNEANFLSDPRTFKLTWSASF